MTGRPKVVREEGFTLVELLLAMMLVFVLLGVTMTALVTSTGIVKTMSQLQNLNEEARLALNRMARDLRQAAAVVAAVNPDGPGFSPTRLVGFRLKADFDGDGCVGGSVVAEPVTGCLPYNAANPEDISYCYEPWSEQLYVIDNQSRDSLLAISDASLSCQGGTLLAGHLASFKLEYRSNSYRHDVNPGDGITTWMELDQAVSSTGNANGKLDLELVGIDSIVVDLTMRIGSHSQTYRTQVDLRNHS